VDAHAFEILTGKGTDPQDLDQAVAVYGGPFLQDLEETWARRYREHLGARFDRLVLDAGSRKPVPAAR